MISVLLIWIYMMITAYLIGFGFLSLPRGIKSYAIKSEDSYIMAGIAVVTVYAQAFSLFAQVGLAAHLILVAVCMGIAIGLRKRLKEHLCRWRLSVSPVRILVIIFLLLLFAFGTSRGIIHYDTGLYHAQSIRWIEEYGIVPGLGNLHSRLAYNSSSFSLSALYGMKFLGERSFHACAGFLAFWIAKVCLDGIRRGKAKKVTVSDLARVTAVYYLLNIFDEMISPASDYFMVLIFFWIIIKWLDLLESSEGSYVPYALLCLMGVSLMTIKLSAALILLLVLKPAMMMIRGKNKAAIAGFMGLGFLTALPYLIRNVILSGWLLYPSTFFDIFQPDWKIPKGMAEYDFREIQVWGRGYTDVTEYHKPLREWIQPWFAGQGNVDKVFILAAVGAVVALLLMLCYMLLRKKWKMADWILVSGTVGVCFIFWLTSAPLIRYGCVYVWLTPIITFGYLYMRISPYIDRHIMLYGALVLIAGYKTVTFGQELWHIVPRTAQEAYLIIQKDYENFPTIAYELQGYVFYYAADGDRTGYEDFPSSPVKAGDIFRGKTIEEGFMIK